MEERPDDTTDGQSELWVLDENGNRFRRRTLKPQPVAQPPLGKRTGVFRMLLGYFLAEQPQPPPKPPADKGASTPGMVIRIVGWISLVITILNALAPKPSMQSVARTIRALSGEADRFSSDNAHGASANALELIQINSEIQTQYLTFILAATISIGLIALGHLMAIEKRLASR